MELFDENIDYICLFTQALMHVTVCSLPSLREFPGRAEHRQQSSVPVPRVLQDVFAEGRPRRPRLHPFRRTALPLQTVLEVFHESEQPTSPQTHPLGGSSLQVPPVPQEFRAERQPAATRADPLRRSALRVRAVPEDVQRLY